MTNFKFPSKLDLSQTILWQYANAPRLKQIIFNLEEALNMSTVDMWNELMVILDMTRPISSTDEDIEIRKAGLIVVSSLFGINRPNNLSDEAFRRYILGYIYLIDSNGSLKDLNAWLKIVFYKYSCHVIEFTNGLNMSINYSFPNESELDSASKEIIAANILPHPAGVFIGTPTEVVDSELGMSDETGTYNDVIHNTGYDENVDEPFIRETLDNGTFDNKTME